MNEMYYPPCNTLSIVRSTTNSVIITFISWDLDCSCMIVPNRSYNLVLLYTPPPIIIEYIIRPIGK